ncbi:hypothetical protein TcCL_ESM06842 [Trypanosoma cruzi]|nr:hypothetical protein TcCL_ESM06842 [Trypanosoma cruzi]
MRAAERHVHFCACRACRCREEMQAALHFWGAEAFFSLCSAGEATLPAGDLLLCIDTLNGASRSRVVAMQLLCSSPCTWPLSLPHLQDNGLKSPNGRLFTCFSFFLYSVERRWGINDPWKVMWWFSVRADGV